MFKRILKLLVIILFIGFGAIFLRGFYHKEVINLENDSKENLSQNENQEINNNISSNQEDSEEEISQNSSKDKNMVSNKQKEKTSSKEVKKNKSTTTITSKNETTNTNKSNVSTSNNSSSKEKTSTSTNELSKCSDNNSEWLSFVEQQRKNGKVVSNSMTEAIDYGEKASNYGYGYWYNKIKETYKGKTCTRDYYYTYLYVPPKICTKNGEYNSKFNVKPAFDKKNIKSVIDYLKSLGYDCGNKE